MEELLPFVMRGGTMKVHQGEGSLISTMVVQARRLFPSLRGDRARVRYETTDRCRTFALLCFLLFVLNSLLVFFSPSLLLAQTNVQYQNRGNRYEGVKPKPVAGYDIELISVLVDYDDSPTALQEEMKVQFYLAEGNNVFLTVRELDYKYYYWMDRIKPDMPWNKGYQNTFHWPTETILKKLGDNIDVYDFGVIARIGNAKPKAKERIAPVILYHSQLPSKVKGYRFTFKTAGDARLSCMVFEENSRKAIWRRTVKRQIGGIPITVTWDATQAKSGSYRFMVKGFFLSDNSPIHQTVQFYHQPDLK